MTPIESASGQGAARPHDPERAALLHDPERAALLHDPERAALLHDPERAALLAEVEKLRKINGVLMDRVENDFSAQGANAFTLFQAAITLENRVAERTAELTDLTHRLFQEITERRAAEQAMLVAKAEAEKANLSKTRFLAAASHDLHQPLNIARLFLGMLGEAGDAQRRQDLLAGIHAALDTVDELLRTILDISRLDAGVWPVEITSFPIAPLLERLRQDYEPQAEAVGLRLRVAQSSAFIASDRVLLERVLRNLISNALRYTKEGKILIGCRRRGEDLEIKVLDTGVGIAPEHLELIFEEFRQAGASAREGERGLGLGLAITQRVARLVDAKIEVASTPARGSVFTLRVRLGGAGACEPSAPRDVARAPLTGLCVAVIDNDAHMRAAVAGLLQSWSCVAISARSAQEAIARIKARGLKPAIVVVDYHLDGGELGTDAIAALRAAFGENVRALVVSNDSRGELQRDLERLGLPFLRKPPAPMKLRAMLAALAAQPV